MEENRKEMIVKSILTKLECSPFGDNRYEFHGGSYSDGPMIETTDGNKHHLVNVWASDSDSHRLDIEVWNEITEDFIVTEKELSDWSLSLIHNSIKMADPKHELLDEITHKLRVQPVLPYTFDKMIEIQLFDGNKFDCLGLALNNGGNLDITAWSAYTEEFMLVYDDLTEESLQELSDNIMPPRTLLVEFCYSKGENSFGAFAIHQHDVPWSFTEEQMLGWLKDNFPVLEWIHDDENQYVCYPVAERHDHYILATCDKE